MHARFEIRSSHGPQGKRWRVVLIGVNGEIVMSSETLNSLDAARTNVAAVRRYASTETVIEAEPDA